MKVLKENSICGLPYFRLSLIFVFCCNLLSCSNKEYPDLSHLPLHYFDYERDCINDSQCKSVGWGGGRSCGTPEKSVAGYIVYSTSIGHKNIRRLKRLAKDSRDDYQKCRVDPKCRDSLLLEEVLPICLSKAPTLFCHNNKCRKRVK